MGADTGNSRVLRVDQSTGNVTLIATGFSPRDLAVDSNGTWLWVADAAASCVRQIELNSGSVSTAAGQCGQSGATGDDGNATAALLNAPVGLALETSGALLIAGVPWQRALCFIPMYP